MSLVVDGRLRKLQRGTLLIAMPDINPGPWCMDTIPGKLIGKPRGTVQIVSGTVAEYLERGVGSIHAGSREKRMIVVRVLDPLSLLSRAGLTPLELEIQRAISTDRSIKTRARDWSLYEEEIA